MLKFIIISAFPDIFNSFLVTSLLHKAQERQLVEIERINLKEYGIGKHLKIDGTPYGGGAGMLIRPEPIVNCLRELKTKGKKKIHRVLLTPQGKSFNQKRAIELSKMDCEIALICGRYEGFDERIRNYIDEEISLGDFVLLGGEIPAMAIIEAICRLIPGIIGNAESLKDETFSQGLIEYSQYTKPFEFDGYQVPEILLSGDHKKIEKWRKADALEKTRKKRPDLLDYSDSKTD